MGRDYTVNIIESVGWALPLQYDRLYRIVERKPNLYLPFPAFASTILIL